jgi:hypothetical protein
MDKVRQVEQVLADVLAVHASAVTTSAGVARVQYDYSSSGKLAVILSNDEDGTEERYDLIVSLKKAG